MGGEGVGPLPRAVIFSAAMSRQKTTAEVDPDMAPEALLSYFAKVPDPRIARSRLHPLSSILVMSLCAVVCGAESFVGIEEFARGKEAWLKTFLELPNGIPSHDTIGRVLAALNPSALASAFREWVSAVAKLTNGEVVAIDGKTLRRSFREAGSSVFVHISTVTVHLGSYQPLLRRDESLGAPAIGASLLVASDLIPNLLGDLFQLRRSRLDQLGDGDAHHGHGQFRSFFPRRRRSLTRYQSASIDRVMW